MSKAVSGLNSFRYHDLQLHDNHSVEMKNLTSATWIKIKGILFLLLGTLSAILLFLELPTLKVGLLLALAIWGFCRFYYFAFYVIEHYVDPSYRFAGLLSFVSYLIGREKDKH